MLCPACQTANPDVAHFCLHCGLALHSAVLPPSERRRVTIMFADLVGFTAIVEQTDAEQVQRIINSCFDQLVPIVEQYGGTVDKFIGDAVMALFGAPIAHEDDAVRALHAALDMQAVLREFNRVHATDLALHIGINTGMVIAGGIGSRGRQQYSVIGDAVNLASRLTNVAIRDEVVIGEETYRMATHAFSFAHLPPTPIKGRAEPVTAWKLCERKAQPESERGLTGLISPMVGRTSELELLLQRSDSLLAGAGAAVMLVGEAGIGKSRLLAEWRSATRARWPDQPIRWVEGRCLSYGQDIAYHLLRDILRSLIDVHMTADHAAIAAALQAFLADVFGDDAPAVHAPLRHLLLLESGDNTDPQAMQAQYQAALRTTLLALAARSPLVIALEDIHWADAASIEIISRLMDLKDQAAILLVATTRPDHDVPGWKLLLALGEASPNSLMINLEPLSAANSRQLVANLLRFEALPEAVRHLILSRADGNPFFVEEVIRTLIERGAIVPTGDQWTAPQAIETLDLPNNVHGLLAARVDRLPPEQKNLLRVAAVIGRRFSVPVLAAVLGTESATLIAQLEHLSAIDLLRHDQSEPEVRYRFRHALVHEVVYDATLHEERRRLHGQVGQILAELYPTRREALAATLAHHFTLADHKHALTYLLLAGDVAFRQYAVVEAVNYYRRAHERLAKFDLDSAALRQFYCNYGRALELHGEFTAAVGLYNAMIVQAERDADQPMLLAALIEQARLGVTPSVVRNLAGGRQLAENALILAQTLDDQAAEARVYWILALAYGFSGEISRAISYGNQSLRLARKLNLREQMAYALHDLHRAYRNTSQFDHAKVALEEATILWRELGNWPMLADSLASAADLSLVLGDYDGALLQAQESHRLSQSIGNVWNEAFSSGVLTQIFFDRGHFSEALYWAGRAITLSQRSGPVILTMRAQIEMAAIYLMLGDATQARRALQATKDVDEQLEQFMRDNLRLSINALSAEVALLAGDEAEAERILNESISSDSQGDRLFFNTTLLLLARARLALQRGEWASVLDLTANLLTRANSGPRFSTASRILYLRGTAQMMVGALDDAEQSLKQALAVVQPIKARTAQWLIEWSLSELASHRGHHFAAAQWHAASVANIQYMLDHITDSRLRELFLARAAVQAVLVFTPAVLLEAA